jgi:hypothetical protein
VTKECDTTQIAGIGRTQFDKNIHSSQTGRVVALQHAFGNTRSLVQMS